MGLYAGHAESFSVGSNVGFDLDATYRSSMISGISDTKPVFTVNVGAQWNFLKNKATLSLTCSDLFDTMRMKVRNRYAGQHIDLNMGQYSRTLSVKFVYRLAAVSARRRRKWILHVSEDNVFWTTVFD